MVMEGSVSGKDTTQRARIMYSRSCCGQAPRALWCLRFGFRAAARKGCVQYGVRAV